MRRLRLPAMCRLVGATALCVGLPNPATAGQSTLAAAVAAALPTAQETYVFLHANPELGKKEVRAHDFLLARLKGAGFTHFEAVASLPTAVIAVFDSGRPGKTIALRAEMDARPLAPGTQEPVSHTPRSGIAGVMHNCGHDLHAAILMAVATLVKANPARFSGRIVFLFQPAEEVAGGADDIVRDGLLARLGVKRIFAEHVAPGLPVGIVAASPGATLAGSNYFTLKLAGRGSHAAAPYDGDDVLLAAMKVVEDISYLPARDVDVATRPMVVSVTKFTADSGATNVLPASATAEGTIRAFEDIRATPLSGTPIATILAGRIDALAAANGLKASLDLRSASPPTENDPTLFDEVVPAVAAAFSGRIDTHPSRGMFSEDFAFYTSAIPALYVSLGISKGDLGHAGVHTAEFTAHPDALAVGIELMSLLAEAGTADVVTWR